MSATVPPIIAAVEAVNRAYARAREVHTMDPVSPTLMVAAHTHIADVLEHRLTLIVAEMNVEVPVQADPPPVDLDVGQHGTLPLVLADPVKYWALQRAQSADHRDIKAARELADWWSTRRAPARRG